jgi:membrane-associated protease RseP (regulator of RpoE activity)
MANSTRNRGAKPAPPPEPAPTAPPEPQAAAKRRSPWTIVGIVVGALVILALVCGAGVTAGFGLSGGLARLAALRGVGRMAYDHDWMMPYGQHMAPYGQPMMPYGQPMMPYGPYGYPFDQEVPPGIAPLAGAAYLGVTYSEVDADQAKTDGLQPGEGALVATVVDGSPAAGAGLQPGDIILEVDGQRLVRTGMLRRLIQVHQPEDVVTLLILREGAEQSLDVTLGSIPQNQTP